jgi:hypothetical protein
MTSTSVRAYKAKLEDWGYKKYNSRQKGAAVVSLDFSQELDPVQSSKAASEWVDQSCCYLNIAK